jgi:DNA-binding MarR family transcriptional regulator
MFLVDFDFVDRPNSERINLISHKYSGVDANQILLFIDFQWTYREAQKQYDLLLSQYQLSESRFIILMFLLNAKDHQLSPSELTKKLGATKATVSKLIKGIETKEWVKKIDSPTDGRASFVQLTEKGEKVLEAFLPFNFKAAQMIMSELGKEDMNTLRKIMKKINLGTQKLKNEMENDSL